MSRGGDFSKKRRFRPFFVSPPLSKVKNCYSDNFDASGLGHGSFEALWATVKWQHWKSGNFFQNWGPSPLWSQPIQDRVPQKSCFRAFFFLGNHFFDPFRPNEDPQVLYMAGKLWISSLWWYKEKNIFLHPVERMIFWDAPHRYFPLYWEAVLLEARWQPSHRLCFFCPWLLHLGKN